MIFPPLTIKPEFNITRASHVVLGVCDLGASRSFYVDMMGLAITAEERDTLYLRGMEEGCHHSLVRRRGEAPSCIRVGMRVQTDEDLDPLADHFKRHGLPAGFVDVPHQGRTIHATDPA